MRALFVSPRLIEGARFIMGVYRAHLKTSFLMYLHYRASSVLWLLDMVLGPVIYLVVWSTIARANGGVVDGYRAGDFAAYFLVLLLVNHLTDNWVYYEFEGRVRQGLLSPLLLRPIHPIHADVAQNLTYKWMMLVVMLPTAGVLALVFHPTAHVTWLSLLLFFPSLARWGHLRSSRPPCRCWRKCSLSSGCWHFRCSSCWDSWTGRQYYWDWLPRQYGSV